MQLFHRNLDPSLAQTRRATVHDITAISRLLRSSNRRYLSLHNLDLYQLLEQTPAMVLATSTDIWGAVFAGPPNNGVTWLRTLTLVNNLSVQAGISKLLPPFHEALRDQGVQHLYYGGDELADRWLLPALSNIGYQPDTTVVVYEKRGLDIPSEGNPHAQIRRAQLGDLKTLIAIDQSSFDPQWHKEVGIIGPALLESPYFIIAELNGEIAGYAFITSHFGGRLIHLVRIAVMPAYRNQAVGVRLLAEIVKYARNASAESITLNTQLHNTTAQRLYSWFGFHRTGEQQTILRFDCESAV
jgi:ribosomal-protein-alanine N-acetyltransferase